MNAVMSSRAPARDASADAQEALRRRLSSTLTYHGFIGRRKVRLKRAQRGERDLTPDQGTSGVSMDLPETTTQSFIVKVWLEATAEEAGGARWRGYITQVPSGERRYLKDLDDITAFIAPYLERMGVRLATRWRVGRCLERWLRTIGVWP